MIVGAYAAAPSKVSDDPNAEGRFLDAVTRNPDVTGLEVPFAGALHPAGSAWLLRRLPRELALVVTTVPGTAALLRADPRHGLASDDSDARASALRFTRTLLDAVHEATDRGHPVPAVHLASAPGGLAASSAALAASLSEIVAWEWGPTRVVIEHCDAPRPDHPPAKGYLPLAEEIGVILGGGFSKVGVVVNWGRSVIETRDPDGGRDHVRDVAAAGLLAGVMFSGASASATGLGGPWADNHVPFSDMEPTSLLTVERARDTLRAAGVGTHYVGVKVGAPAAAEVDSRIRAVTAAVAALRRARSPVPSTGEDGIGGTGSGSGRG